MTPNDTKTDGKERIPRDLAWKIWLSEKFSRDPPEDAEVKIRDIDTGA